MIRSVKEGGSIMITLNEDYSNIKKEIEYIKNHMLDCKTPNETVIYRSILENLILLYYECTGEMYIDKKINHSHYAAFTSQMQGNILKHKYHKNYLANKDFHLEMFMSSVYLMIDTLNDYFASDEYLKLFQTYHPPIDIQRNEDIDILHQYFKEKDIVLIDILNDLQAQGRIYSYNGLLDGEKRPLASLNPIENKVNIFIPSKIRDISFLSSLVHELAHIKDFYDILDSTSKKAQQMYAVKSLYTEVLSTEYQIGFLEFLIGNNIYKERAQLELASLYNSYIDFLDDAITYTALPSGYHFDAIGGRFSQREMIEIINPDYKELDSIEDRMLFDFQDCIQYSYGILVSSTIANGQSVREQFLTIRHSSFDKNSLISSGITPEAVAKNVEQKMKTYLKS